MSESESEAKGFKVTDRRKFTPEGDPRTEADETSEEAAPKADSPPKQDGPKKEAEAPSDSATRPTAQREETRRAQPGQPPAVSFLDLVNMLASNALVQLGDVPDPISGKPVENLQGVQVMVAFLEMLEERTKGNLTSDEEKLLVDVLYDLRMRYMTKANLIKR